ncbi:hypothetical protein B0J13DRAFT_575968 [Dactylonectria estremocensis]|uniref:Uncharacterized protein n=1 Tax=Dactylonectria estremocensis TaxID=1079267 RepID=A0A9P9D417_9HYPO|nr:hypothetical protein B0J13DRAFT_575968 [Dactylonectria estremocensis]
MQLQKLPGELLMQVENHLPPPFIFSFVQSITKKSDFFSFSPRNNAAAIWGLIVKDESWTQEVVNMDRSTPGAPVPCLVGQDLVRVSRGRPRGAHLVLLIQDWAGDSQFITDKFFKSLRPHLYNKEKSEIFLTESGLTVNILDALGCSEEIQMTDPRKLFGCRRGKLSTQVLYYTGNVLEEIQGQSIASVDGVSMKRKKAVSQVCSIKLKFRGGETAWRVFSSASQPIRAVPKRDGQWITGWRVTEPGERGYGQTN